MYLFIIDSIIKKWVLLMNVITNFRDLGGYVNIDGKHIKKDKIYRSGHFDRIKGQSLDSYIEYGIKTVIDLREPVEIKYNKKIPEKIKILNYPINFDQSVRKKMQPMIYKKDSIARIFELYISTYSSMVIEKTDILKSVFDILLDPLNYPVHIHCRAGKDRTGFISAVIMLALNIDEKIVIDDYLKTNNHFLPRIQNMLRYFKILTFGLLNTKNIEFIAVAHRKYIETIMETIHSNFGNVTNYLDSIGITKDKVNKLRDLLLE